MGYSRRSSFLQGDPEAVLLIEVSGESETELEARLERIEGSLRRGNMGYAFVKMTSSEEQAKSGR